MAITKTNVVTAPESVAIILNINGRNITNGHKLNTDINEVKAR